MNNTNCLISGDNKGYASYLFEKYKNGNSSLPGIGMFNVHTYFSYPIGDMNSLFLFRSICCSFCTNVCDISISSLSN